jgi:hypothetical protein
MRVIEQGLTERDRQTWDRRSVDSTRIPPRCPTCGSHWTVREHAEDIVLSERTARSLKLDVEPGPVRMVRLHWHCPRGHPGGPTSRGLATPPLPGGFDS